MSKLKIYGHSDDLVEIEGDIREEWEAFDAGQCYIAISDGTLLHITYDHEGVWRVTPCVIGEGTNYSNKQAVSANFDNSDEATLSNDKPFLWAVLVFNEENAYNPTLPAVNGTEYVKRVHI